MRDLSIPGRDTPGAPLEPPFLGCAVDDKVFLGVLGNRRRWVSEGARWEQGEGQAREGSRQCKRPTSAQLWGPARLAPFTLLD